MSATAQLDGRRAVGDRNRSAILEAAIHTLAAQPDAGVAEVAAAADVGRATVYRHFTSREELIDALRERARDEARERFAAARLDEGPPLEALERIVSAMLELGDRYRVIFPPAREHRSDVLLRPLSRLIARAQAEGVLDASLPANWIVASLRALLKAAVGEIDARRLARDGAAARVVRTLVSGCAAP